MKQAPATPDSDPSQRIEMIRGSLRCFYLGLAGLIPVIGIPFALVSVLILYKVRKAAAGWNPAERYLKAAGWLGPLGLLTTALFFMALAVMNSAVRDGFLDCSSGHG